MKRPAACPRVARRPASALPAPKRRRLRLASAPLSAFRARVSLAALEREAQRFGFDAQAYLSKGYTVLPQPVLSEAELAEALAAARRVRQSSGGEFMFLRKLGTSDDKRLLFTLLSRYLPLLHQLFNGIRLPGSDWAPYAHHNQVQVAIKEPGFEGYDSLEKMYSAKVGHIDQPNARQRPEGRRLCNFSASLGVVLHGATEGRDDAGNLFVAPGTHRLYAEAFRRAEDAPCWWRHMEEHYLDHTPRMVAVRARPGQAVLMHHQTMHGVGPNRSEVDRVHVYFRLTAAGRPTGGARSFVPAMRDPELETPLLRALAERQRGRPSRP